MKIGENSTKGRKKMHVIFEKFKSILDANLKLLFLFELPEKNRFMRLDFMLSKFSFRPFSIRGQEISSLA